jgi:hypothetical protein
MNKELLESADIRIRMAREEGLRSGRKEGASEKGEEIDKLNEFLRDYKQELEDKSVNMIRIEDEKQQLMMDKQIALEEIDYMKSQINAERDV